MPLWLTVIPIFTGVAFATEAALVAYMTKEDEAVSDIWGGLVFTDTFDDPDTLPKQVHYKIRPWSKQRTSGSNTVGWLTNYMFPIGSFDSGPRDAFSDVGGEPCKCL